MKINENQHITKDGLIKRNPYSIPILYHGSETKFDRFTLDGIKLDSTDQNGVGIYLTDSIEEAKIYGKYIYVVDLYSDKKVQIQGKVSRNEILFLINNAPDKEMALSNYAEREQEAIKQFFLLNSKFLNQPHEMFQTMWYEFYRYEPKKFIVNMVRLGYDFVKVKSVKSNHYIVYNWEKIKILNVINRE
jgi:hypothetical protein